MLLAELMAMLLAELMATLLSATELPRLPPLDFEVSVVFPVTSVLTIPGVTLRLESALLTAIF